MQHFLRRISTGLETVGLWPGSWSRWSRADGYRVHWSISSSSRLQARGPWLLSSTWTHGVRGQLRALKTCDVCENCYRIVEAYIHLYASGCGINKLKVMAQVSCHRPIAVGNHGMLPCIMFSNGYVTVRLLAVRGEVLGRRYGTLFAQFKKRAVHSIPPESMG